MSDRKLITAIRRVARALLVPGVAGLLGVAGLTGMAGACVSGCGPRDDPADDRPAARVALSEPAPAAPPALPSADEFPMPPPAPDVHDQERTNEALVVAADAAEAARAGSDDCETAHNQLIAMLRTVTEQLGEQVHQPEREAFVEVCRDMPQAARRCIMPTYAMANQDACTTALEALPDDVRQRFQIVVNGPGAD